MSVDETSTPLTSTEYALALATTLESSPEITLGPTDQELCAAALRAYAAQLDTALAA